MTTPTQESKLPEFNQTELDARIARYVDQYANTVGSDFAVTLVSHPTLSGIRRYGRGRQVHVIGDSHQSLLNAVEVLSSNGFVRIPELDFTDMTSYLATQRNPMHVSSPMAGTPLQVVYLLPETEWQEIVQEITEEVTAAYVQEFEARKRAFLLRQVELTKAAQQERERQAVLAAEQALAEKQQAEDAALYAEIEAELFGEPAPTKPRRKAA